MHHGIPPYHVAEMWAGKDEKGARERERGESGWSGDFVLRRAIVRLHCKINKENTTTSELQQNVLLQPHEGLPSGGFSTDFPLVQWCIHIPASAHKWPV